MDLSNLTRGVPRKARKRVGRGPGSGHGKTAGRGHKGQKARSGYSRKHAFEGGQMPLSRRVPKRGFRHQKRFPVAPVNVDVLQRVFDADTEVTPEVLARERLIDALPGGVKVLGRGDLTKRLTVKVHAVSAGARKKIEAAGGTVELLTTSAARRR